ncbi:uncharacterized protein VNE69_02275 [Vairimorpha necatrix]|uniref:Uncharacterized protein n=1 Tax=Vairimorpha necatrix TaxID=6039 RepID=A0AAX4JA23_9MICR
MKFNTKDLHLPRLLGFTDDLPIYEDILDPLSKSWNDLHLLNSSEDTLSELRTQLNLCKVEVDTLNSTYDLLNKGIIRQVGVKEDIIMNDNINIIRPCIEYIDRGLDILNSKNETNKEVEFYFYIRCRDFVYVENRSTSGYLVEQEFENEDYFIKIKRGRMDNVDSNINIDDLVDFIINNNINISRNIYYINLYISKIFILKYKEDGEVVNYGKILEDGLGERVFIIRDEIYKIERSKTEYKIYKDEKRIH